MKAPAFTTPPRTRGGVLLCLLLAVLVPLAGCTVPGRGAVDTGSVDTCLASLENPPSEVTGVFVQPDDGYPPVVDELVHARCTIDLTIYMLTDDAIFAALGEAADRGVQVRVILDQHPYGMFGNQQEAMDRLLSDGVEVKWGASEHQFTHAKYMVVDGRVAVIMNQNLTRSAFDGNREFGVVTTEPEAVRQAQQLFDADWAGKPSAQIAGPLIVSPETSRARITQLIGEAETSVDFYAEVIRDTGIIGALRSAVQRGVTVRLIVNATVDPEDLEALIELSAMGVQVRMMEQMYIHAKTLILDEERALIGSQNYTMTSLDRNREVGMVVEDPALLVRVVAVYERDWIRAVPAEATGGYTGAPSGLADSFARLSPLPAIGFRIIAYPLTLNGESGYSVRTVPKGWAHDIGQPEFILADIAAGLCSITR